MWYWDWCALWAVYTRANKKKILNSNYVIWDSEMFDMKTTDKILPFYRIEEKRVKWNEYRRLQQLSIFAVRITDEIVEGQNEKPE